MIAATPTDILFIYVSILKIIHGTTPASVKVDINKSWSVNFRGQIQNWLLERDINKYLNNPTPKRYIMESRYMSQKYTDNMSI